MACFGQSITAFSSDFPACSSQSQKDQSERAEETRVFAFCAVALIRAKLAEVQR